MKKRFFYALLALVLAAATLPASALAEGDAAHRIVTSYDPGNYLEFTISGDTLTVSGKLRMEGLNTVRVACGSDQEMIKVGDGEFFTAQLTLAFSEPTAVTVYTSTKYDVTGGGMMLYGYLWDTIYIRPGEGGYEFMRSLVLDNNLALSQAYADPAKYTDASGISEEVKAKSNEIVAGISGNYEKLFALHKWVAENIYYDYDSYYGNGYTYYDGGSVLENKRTVCAGYSSLLVQLIRAQGIPAMETTTFALGLSTNGGSFAMKADKANEAGSNHAHVEAYVDGRWVIMDPTWDSNNKYQNGQYQREAPRGWFYFDITPEMLSMNHKYITRADGRIKFTDGAVTGADPLPVKTAASTSSTVLVNGTEVKFDAYNIGDSNYFKLRDLAYVLSGSEKQFEVTWDPNTGDIRLISGSAYTPVGGELRQGDGSSRSAVLNQETIYLDGCVTALTAYTIDGSNYFKLRDLGTALDFDVTWDGERDTVIIDTSSSYTPD